MRNGKVQALVVDGDGTLIQGNAWGAVHQHHGVDTNLTNALMHAKFRGEISYIQWMDSLARLWNNAGVTRPSIIKSLYEVNVMPGALELLQKAHDAEIPIYLVSGSLDIFVEELLMKHLPSDIFREQFVNRATFHADGKIERLVATPYDHWGKLEACYHISKKEGVMLYNMAMLCDGVNDTPAALRLGKVVAVNAKCPQLRQTACLNVEDLSDPEVERYLLCA